MSEHEWRFETAKAPAAVVATLREQVDPLPTLPVLWPRGRGTFLGVVWNDAFEIRRRERFGKNDFGAILRAKIHATPTGTVVTGSIGPQPIFKIMFWLFFSIGLSLLVAGAVLALFLAGPGRFVLPVVGLGFLVIGSMVCGGFLLVAASDRDRLIRQVEQVLGDGRRTV